jgi:hypothetical protein
VNGSTKLHDWLRALDRRRDFISVFGRGSSGVLLRHLEISSRALTESEVSARTHLRWDFDMFAATEQLKITKEVAKGLQLAKAYGGETAPPLWTSACFCAEFADPFLQKTGMDNTSKCYLSLHVLTLALGQLVEDMKEQPDTHFMLMGTGPAALQADQKETLQTVLDAVQTSEKLFLAYQHLVEAVLESRNPLSGFENVGSVVDEALKALARFFKDAKARNAEFVLMPCGWRNSPASWYFITIVIEPEYPASGAEPNSYRVSICNSGLEGIEWHGASAQAPPKIKYRLTLTLDGVREERLFDEGFWTMAYGMTTFWDPKGAKPSRFFYEELLPWLLEMPLRAAAARRSGALEDAAKARAAKEKVAEDKATKKATAGVAEGKATKDENAGTGTAARFNGESVMSSANPEKTPSDAKMDQRDGAANTTHDVAPYRTAQYSETSHYRSILEAVRYLCLRGAPLAEGSRRHGMGKEQVKLVTFGIRDAMMRMAKRDLSIVPAVGQYDHTLITIATQQLALAAVKAVDSKILPAGQLQDVHEEIAKVSSPARCSCHSEFPRPVVISPHPVTSISHLVHLDTMTAPASRQVPASCLLERGSLAYPHCSGERGPQTEAAARERGQLRPRLAQQPRVGEAGRDALPLLRPAALA